MNRRNLLKTGFLASAGALAAGGTWGSVSSGRLGTRGSGVDWKAMKATFHRLLFEEYLPFWELGGYDAEHGGFMCFLYDDGSVQDDRKDIWYQGRGIWVYSSLYESISPDPQWLERAQRSRDFMVAKMHRGDGTWLNTVDRVGNPAESAEGFRDQNIYGALFATVGLIRLALASGDSRDLPLIRKTLRKSVARYEDPAYPGVQVPGMEAAGLRAQGHSFMFVWVLGQMLKLDPSPEWEVLCRQHQQHLVQDFWNPEFGISNEFLSREYKPLPGYADYMVPGHSIEAQWMALQEALRQGNQQEALTLAGRIRRLYEIAWDPIFGGFSDTAYRVFPTADAPAGPVTDLKTMWAQTEVLIACMVAHQLTGESWAVDAYQRTWEFLMRTMPTGTGVWRQAVDRKGKPKEREGISPYRKGNFHQPRLLIMGLQMW